MAWERQPGGPRRLAPADAEAFRALRLEALRDQPAAFGASWEIERARPLSSFTDILERGLVFGVSEDTEGLVGMAGLAFSDLPKMRHRGTVWGVFVRASARGRGVGRALMEAIIRHATGNVEALDLRVGARNEGALALYRTHGFTPYGLERRALIVEGIAYDEILMTRTLGTSAQG